MSRPRILLTRRWPNAVEDRLAERYAVTRNPDDVPLDAAALAAAMRDHDAVCPTVTDRLPREVIAVDGRRARIIANYGAGFEHIDVDAARAEGIAVTNTPDVLTDATADIAMLLILMTTRRASEGERELRAGAWSGWRPTHLLGAGLGGKTLGLIGYGRIARATAARAQAFGMKLIYHSRNRADDMPADAYRATPAALAADADVVSLHAPGGDATRHMVDAAFLSAMRPGAVLVNTARGSLVDEAALAAALSQGTIAAAGLDVYANEPQVTPALLACPNAVLLPHLGSATRETRIAMGMRVADNLDAFFDGAPPRDRVA
ncbi:2-hydroxyacid dehydrogenase [Sphingomonas hengshuiensis]|uniref:2-hydroxyacid dehydrogenase n=1 Tax=Sphingomonas hengshuiensis TaxID=1609977 RepID=A0A7U4J9H9_9SPHN|nr:D-glycerate dehydrogenase [Sphingomonas hengshuiensis]AJP72726.1 2-hydroxyacid dehydrogenase [Sphingomonas hengshuiensis]